MAAGFFKEEGMEPKPRSSLQRKPISEDQIRRAIALGDEMCGRDPGGHPNCPTYGHPNCSTWPG